MHKINTARLEELESETTKFKSQRKYFFAFGAFFGLFVTNVIWFALDRIDPPTIVYSHVHDGPRNQRSGSTFRITGATFTIPYEGESNISNSIEGPQTFEEMMDCALDDFEQFKFFEQNHQSDDSPIKAIEIKVWK